MYLSIVVSDLLREARQLAAKWKHMYITPEHLAVCLCDLLAFKVAFENCGGDSKVLQEELKAYLENEMEVGEEEPTESFSLQQVFIEASHQVINSGKDEIELHHVVAGIMRQEESYVVYYMACQGVSMTDLLYELCHNGEEIGEEEIDKERVEEDLEEMLEDEDEASLEEGMSKDKLNNRLKEYVTNLNELVKNENQPFIGREDIIERTLQILCRKDKNNAIHIGEPGVGKTAITKGLAKRINEGRVPKSLKDATILELDLGATLAGTQYRGDFEKRIKKILNHIKTMSNPIVYIDEIHNLVGAGSLGSGSLDASNLLKPYLTQSKIRFIGATTYDEYKKHFEKDKALARRFQTVEIKEPTLEETLTILEGIKPYYEAFHHVVYTEEALKAAVKLSHQYITGKFLPDKAIDLLDEAGAYYRAGQITEGDKEEVKSIDLSIIEATLARICHIPKNEVEADEVQNLKNLEKQLKEEVFGQDEAVSSVTRAIKLSRAGLKDEGKPTASLLFVGPTGVGKTELAKCLAKALNIAFVRFDMSEYTEKHTASKLIGSPPGYVGYEEGGLLTDAIRKNPYCVLLLDEIEKAHQDIYNMLLQVMDYATLTDNQGKKSDFRNVILIMTSNLGASKIGKKLVGFGERTIEDEVVQEAVKKAFTPEFRNRLTEMIQFHHINAEMAKSIVHKQLNKLKSKLEEKQIDISFEDKVIEDLCQTGISSEYGARKIQRLIEGKIKPLLVDEMLFGALVSGGRCKVTMKDSSYQLEVEEIQ